MDDLDLHPFLTVFQSKQDDGWLIMRLCAMEPFFDWKDFLLKQDSMDR